MPMSRHISQSASSRSAGTKSRRAGVPSARRPGGAGPKSLPVAAQVEELLRLPARQRIEVILQSEAPSELVHRMPAEEVLLTIEEVGKEAALPLLAATSSEQFNFLTDIEIWEGDEVDWERTRAWLLLLVECGDDKILDWLQTADVELIVLILKKFLTIYQTDPGEIPTTELQRFTLDGVYHFCTADGQLLDAVRRILALLRLHDRDQYLLVVDSALWAQLTELEHEAARWRQSRLAEHGFPDDEEAAEIYRYVPRHEMQNVIEHGRRRKPVAETDRLAPRYPLQVLEASDAALMVRSVGLLQSPEDVAYVSGGLVSVANRLQVADSMPLGRLSSIRSSAAKTAGYVNIALEVLAEENPERAADLLANVHAQHLFRIGSSRVEDVAARARRLVRRGWLHGLPGAQELLDTPEREVLKGLLGGQVRLYTGKTEGEEYREFRSCADLQLAEGVLEEIEAIGHLLIDHLHLEPQLFAEILRRSRRWARDHDLRLSTLFLSAAVRFLLGQEFSSEPLTPEDVRTFLRSMSPGRERSTGGKTVWDRARRRLYRAIGLRDCRTSTHLHEAVAGFVDRHWRRLEEELASLSPRRAIDPRFIQCLIVEKGRSV